MNLLAWPQNKTMSSAKAPHQMAQAEEGGARPHRSPLPLSPHAMNHEQRAVPRAPHEEVQARPMPQPADEHGGHHVHIHAGGPRARSAERNEHVVHQPRGQRTMPTA